MPYDTHNPLTVSLPYNFVNNHDYPTEVMANRFSAWRAFIKEILNYFKEYSSVQEEIVRQQSRLQQSLSATARSLLVPNGGGGGGSGGINLPTSPLLGGGGGGGSGSHNSNGSQDIELINKFFLPVDNGSVQDVPNVLFKYHQQNVALASRTLKDINTIIIPKLEELRKDLLVKIKEIKNLQNDFKNNLGKEMNETKSCIGQYNQAIDTAGKLDNNHNFHTDGDPSKYDPYLVKIKLDRQLKRQLVEENYLYDAYSNLQTAGKQLEGIVVTELQSYLHMFLNLVGEENSTFTKYLVPHITEGFLSKESNFEWNAFIERNLPTNNLNVSAVGNHTTSSIKNGTFIDLDIPKRHFSDIIINNYFSNLNVAVREGYLERRSKFLKNYSSAWYVLTCSFIHEFKSNDRKKDPHPVMSLPLNSCTVSDHSKDDGRNEGAYKFILTSKSANALMHKTHKWVFRTSTYQDMIDWFNDILKLTKLPTPSSRARTLPERSRENLQTAALGKTMTNSSSIRSPPKSLRTFESNQSQLQRGGSRSARATSETTSNVKRLSSTFSQKNQSPRIANMVNSDGTIITPVDTYGDLKRNSSRMSHHDVLCSEQNQHQQQHQQQQQQQQQQQHYPNIPRSQSPALSYQPYHLIPVESMGGANGGNHYQHEQSFGSNPASVPYYIPSTPQQFYDPVQQQYYTITPSMPSTAQQSSRAPSLMQHINPQPQPQYFNSGPHAGSDPTVTSSPNVQPFGSAYFANYNNQQPLQQQQQQQPPHQSHQSAMRNPAAGESVPYPTSDPSNSEVAENSGEIASQTLVNNEQLSAERAQAPLSVPRQLSADEVSTLKSSNLPQPESVIGNGSGDINIVIAKDD
ncbi:uncharacterized protein LODBEIA_P41020 [Lodderomyces beijingensis]|uniref:PH domain-containing protein n=1 Tax=Lodderomyces beijingensis TaxID=1775926 RepID=A0ABP0ZNZ3_9ASCO